MDCKLVVRLVVHIATNNVLYLNTLCQLCQDDFILCNKKCSPHVAGDPAGQLATKVGLESEHCDGNCPARIRALRSLHRAKVAGDPAAQLATDVGRESEHCDGNGL